MILEFIQKFLLEILKEFTQAFTEDILAVTVWEIPATIHEKK